MASRRFIVVAYATSLLSGRTGILLVACGLRDFGNKQLQFGLLRWPHDASSSDSRANPRTGVTIDPMTGTS